MKPANKFIVRCLGCDEPLTVITNKSLPNHEKPVAFCSMKCFNEFRNKPRRMGGE